MTTTIFSHRDLIVWQKAMDLLLLLYRLTAKFPRAELYGLGAQMRKSAVSIPSHIAEGKKQHTKKDYRRYLLAAYASSVELETHIEIAKRLSFGDAQELRKADALLLEVIKILGKMTSNLKPAA